MATEIEKKYLLTRLPSSLLENGITICQGYMLNSKECTVRVRTWGDSAFLTVKGPSVNGVRNEFEYKVPVEDATQMLGAFCAPPLIEKIRYRIPYKGFTWEVDRFKGENNGLIVAEIELEFIDQPFEKPDWIGREVTHDPKYLNANLIHRPFSHWSEAERGRL
jgi:adenylate cyclase